MDVFEFAKENKLAIHVEYVEPIDTYRVVVMDERYAMDIMLDGIMMENRPDFRKRALEHCLEQYITRRR